MKLSKKIPARTETEHFNWCRKDFMLYGDFKKYRERYKMKVLKGCQWCRKPFNEKDMMAIAQPKSGKNKLLCGECADILLSQKETVNAE